VPLKKTEKKTAKPAIPLKKVEAKPIENTSSAKPASTVNADAAKPSNQSASAKQLPVLSKEFRPWVIWIWNLAITKDELIKQLYFFIEQKFSGVAIKIGRDMTPAFLSEEFFDLFREVLLIAQKEKIGIRLAEDFSMPLDGAFESLAQKNRSVRGQYLTLEFSQIIPDKENFEKTIADPINAIVQIAKIESEKVFCSKLKTITFSHNDNPVVTWKAQAGEHQFMVFRKKDATDPLGGYVPNVYREQTARLYTDLVWEAFHKNFSKFIPTTFEGFISELPAYLPTENGIPWDDDLIVKYRSKYKKDLLGGLPSLFFATEALEVKNRAHIYSFLLHSMHERFTTALDKWCKKYRLTNWVLCPERPINKSNAMLRDVMTIPEQMFPVVGIQNQEGSDENAAIARAMADANTREFKRETITVIGRNRMGNAASLQSLKSEIDQSTLAGPSRIVLDGCFFNIDHKSYIKTPCNPSWYAPGKENVKDLCDYASRVKKLITPLQLSRQVAILLPTQSVMTDFLVSNDEAVRKAMLSMHKTMDELFALDLEFDIITEEMLLSCTLFPNGEFNNQNKSRKGNYQALIIPYCRMASKNLFVYLERMAVKKGTIVFIDEAPQGNIDEGITPSFTSRVAKLMRSRTGTIAVTPANDLEASLGHIKPVASVSVQGKKCADVSISAGSSSSQAVFTIINKSDSLDYFATVELPEEKYFYLSDCTSGELHEIMDVQRKDAFCRINLNVAPRQAYFIIGCNQKQNATVLAKSKKPVINVTGTLQRNYRIVLKDQWQFTPNSLNVLPLAAWNTRIGLSREFGGFSHFYESYFEVKDVPEVMALSLFGLNGATLSASINEKSIELNVNGMRITDAAFCDPAKLASLFPSHAAQTPMDPANLADPQINLHTKPCLDLFSKNVPTFTIKDSVRKGINRISLRTLGLVFDPMALTYPPLIAGNFAIIKGPNGWVIDTTMPMVSHDSWTKYGFPYMSGCGTYSQVFEIPSDYNRLVLKLSQVSGTTSIALNETQLDSFNWHPMEIDITDIVSTKRNELSISIVNTIDNMIRMNNRASGLIGEVYLDVY